MYVIQLPDGRLRVPQSALLSHGPSNDGAADPGIAEEGGTVPEGGLPAGQQVIGHAYVEIGPEDPDYDRLRGQALTEEELAARRRRWQDEDADLLRQFEEWKAQQPDEDE